MIWAISNGAPMSIFYKRVKQSFLLQFFCLRVTDKGSKELDHVARAIVGLLFTAGERAHDVLTTEHPQTPTGYENADISNGFHF